MLLTRLANVPCFFYRALILASLAIALATWACSDAKAAPQAQSAEECSVASDMALVAGALAQEGIERELAGKIMATVYEVEDSEQGQRMVAAILKVAYGEKPEAREFARTLYRTCMQHRGNMDGILGADL